MVEKAQSPLKLRKHLERLAEAAGVPPDKANEVVDRVMRGESHFTVDKATHIGGFVTGTATPEKES